VVILGDTSKNLGFIDGKLAAFIILLGTFKNPLKRFSYTCHAGALPTELQPLSLKKLHKGAVPAA